MTALTLVVVSRYRVAEDESQPFLDDARAALTTLSEQAGFVRGHLGRATDDPSLWVLTTEWEGDGVYRRALSSYDVKLRATPVMYRAIEEPSAFEVLESAAGAERLSAQSDRAPDAESAGPGRASGPA